MSTAIPTQISPDDLLTMPDGDRYELIDGELKKLNMSVESSWVAGKVIRLLGPCEDQGIGWVFPEGTSYACFPWEPGRTRRADASYISRERLPEVPTAQGHAHFVPDLAVEVVSPHDTHFDVQSKVSDYLEAGVRLVWVATPHDRTVTVYRQNDPSAPRRLSAGDELTGEDVLPGFSCRVEDLFPPGGDKSPPNVPPLNSGVNRNE